MRISVGSLSFLLFALLLHTALFAQPAPKVYDARNTDHPNRHQEIKLSERYFVLTEYESDPANFIRTLGGFYSADTDSLHVSLEFNSNFANDSIQEVHYKYERSGDSFILNGDKAYLFSPDTKKPQALDGSWLFATRGPDTGQERRGNETPRKTLKLLQDGHFQWIAYNTETMQFFGTGGGLYTAVDGSYTEIIHYFSRDNTRVGAVLDFTYEIVGDDWHHTGKNSKGEPLYEIWARRE